MLVPRPSGGRGSTESLSSSFPEVDLEKPTADLMESSHLVWPFPEQA